MWCPGFQINFKINYPIVHPSVHRGITKSQSFHTFFKLMIFYISLVIIIARRQRQMSINISLLFIYYWINYYLIYCRIIISTQNMTKSNALETRLQDLFQQVNKTIEHLLNNLTYIYQSHGINYKVNSFYQPLIRMLTPL